MSRIWVFLLSRATVCSNNQLNNWTDACWDAQFIHKHYPTLNSRGGRVWKSTVTHLPKNSMCHGLWKSSLCSGPPVPVRLSLHTETNLHLRPVRIQYCPNDPQVWSGNTPHFPHTEWSTLSYPVKDHWWRPKHHTAAVALFQSTVLMPTCQTSLIPSSDVASNSVFMFHLISSVQSSHLGH